jgi:hypothetical protein
LLVSGKNDPPPSIVVLLLPAKSADPPQNSGSIFAIALITFPEAALVAISFSGEKTGKDFSQPSGSFFESNLERSLLSCGLSICHLENLLNHSW